MSAGLRACADGCVEEEHNSGTPARLVELCRHTVTANLPRTERDAVSGRRAADKRHWQQHAA